MTSQVSSTRPTGRSADAPTSIWRPTTISRLPPPDAPRTDSVAMVNAITARRPMAIPVRSAPPCNRVPMMRRTPNVPGQQARDTQQACAFGKDHPVRQRHQKRQGGCDDGGQRSFDPLHRDEVQTQIKSVLTDAEDDHCPPLAARQLHSLSDGIGDGDAQHTRYGKPQGQRQDRRCLGHDDAGRGERRRPHQSEQKTVKKRAQVHDVSERCIYGPDPDHFIRMSKVRSVWARKKAPRGGLGSSCLMDSEPGGIIR